MEHPDIILGSIFGGLLGLSLVACVIMYVVEKEPLFSKPARPYDLFFLAMLAVNAIPYVF